MSSSEENPQPESEKPQGSAEESTPPKTPPKPRPKGTELNAEGAGVPIVVIMQSVGLIIFCAVVLFFLVMCHHRR